MPQIIEVDRWNPSPNIIEDAAKLIRSGRLVAFPTETVYGLGANALDARAVLDVFKAKGRPADNPLILHLCDKMQADDLCFVDDRARALMDHFWPAPLTLVLKARSVIPAETRGGLKTAALRMPFHPVALALIAASGVPIAAPSANKSGRPSPTDAQTVASDLEDGVDMILDSGSCNIGVESTVIDVSGKDIVLLRPGGMPIETVEDFLGEKARNPMNGSEIKASPGTRYRHYAPKIPVIPSPNVNLPRDTAVWGFMGLREPNCDYMEKIIFKTVENYATGFFAGLRHLEAIGAAGIVAEVPSENDGVAPALKDRLFRAAGCISH